MVVLVGGRGGCRPVSRGKSTPGSQTRRSQRVRFGNSTPLTLAPTHLRCCQRVEVPLAEGGVTQGVLQRRNQRALPGRLLADVQLALGHIHQQHAAHQCRRVYCRLQADNAAGYGTKRGAAGLVRGHAGFRPTLEAEPANVHHHVCRWASCGVRCPSTPELQMRKAGSPTRCSMKSLSCWAQVSNVYRRWAGKGEGLSLRP